MKLDGDLAKLITAAHRGNELAQHALGVIEETEKALLMACQHNHVVLPRQFDRTQIEETIASGLIKSSPWLQGVVAKVEPLLL